ncbi:MAG: hypothetical protein DMG65_07285 [Candidatus Angelobacter sp. Gp1-AA117]|nr:MAG: hypothetical protein DMG65_07285 [Candidatus Angelobacter sp. Gp1-AA117]
MSSIRVSADSRNAPVLFTQHCYICLSPMYKPAVADLRGSLIFLILVFSLVVLLSGCGAVSEKPEYAYVAEPEAALRDHVATLYNKTGLVHNGERVQILEHMQNKRFVRVRTSRGEEGWIQDRYLTDQETYDQFQQMAQKFKDVPTQAVAVARRPVNLHVTPGRKSEHLYQLNENDKVELLQRQTADRNAPATAVAKPDKPDKDKDQKDSDKKDAKDKDKDSESDDDQASKPGQPVILEDWWLVRDAQKRVGWVLGRLLYVDVPIEIATYAEGQRIVAFFALDEVQDEDKKVLEYLVLLSDNKDGLPYDYSQVRVFTWNVRRHRYETAYRERGLNGVLPVTLGRGNFGKEGDLRTFTLRVQDENGSNRELQYKFNPPIVRRVLGPGEEPPPKLHRKSRRSR